MKLIEAIIKPFKLEDVKNALLDEGVKTGMTISEVRGFGRQQGHVEMYRGSEYQMDFLPKLKIEILAESDDAKKIVAIIIRSAYTGTIGDGKIFVHDVGYVERIRTGEKGSDALS